MTSRQNWNNDHFFVLKGCEFELMKERPEEVKIGETHQSKAMSSSAGDNERLEKSKLNVWKLFNCWRNLFFLPASLERNGLAGGGQAKFTDQVSFSEDVEMARRERERAEEQESEKLKLDFFSPDWHYELC